MDELLAELGVGLSRTGKMFYGPCPVHGGDNQNALNLYRRGDSVPGYWRCHTGHCEQTFKRTIIGFVRGVLSHQKFGWSPRTQEGTVNFRTAVDWCCQFLGQDLAGLSVDYADFEKRQFTSAISVLARRPEQGRAVSSRGEIRKRLTMPASYFVGRGWSAEVLDRYDVGYCGDPRKPFYERVVVPVYDPDYRHVVGYTARSIHERCGSCRLWHRPDTACPPAERHLQYSKWRNSEGFPRESSLYNYWFSKKPIRERGVVCLCEGPGDVWRLEEAGIHCGVAMLGLSLSDQQQIALELSGAAAVVVLTNMDTPGREAAVRLKKQMGRSFRVAIPELPSKDLGDMTPSAVEATLASLLTGLMRKGTF